MHQSVQKSRSDFQWATGSRRESYEMLMVKVSFTVYMVYRKALGTDYWYHRFSDFTYCVYGIYARCIIHYEHFKAWFFGTAAVRGGALLLKPNFRMQYSPRKSQLCEASSSRSISPSVCKIEHAVRILWKWLRCAWNNEARRSLQAHLVSFSPRIDQTYLIPSKWRSYETDHLGRQISRCQP